MVFHIFQANYLTYAVTLLFVAFCAKLRCRYMVLKSKIFVSFLSIILC